MSDLRPSADFPGLHVTFGTRNADSGAEYVCHCGDSGTATGDRDVKALVEAYDQHKAAHARERGR